MDSQNLAYALIQVAHNFGAASVLGGAVCARWLARPSAPLRRRLAWFVLIGWAVQATSGAAFGAVSYAYYGKFPDLHGIAVAALLLKMACAASGFVLAAFYLKYAVGWSARRCDGTWTALIVLATTALTSAAFLRWFS